MEKMYQQYKDIAEFRIVYINEAHPEDGSWPVQYAKDKGIKQATNYHDRCQTADMLLKDKELNIPTIIDGMDNAVNESYSAWPDRIFLIRTDGRLAVAGKQGPWGYKPALDATAAWLDDYRKTKTEPLLPDGAIEAANKRAAEAKTQPRNDENQEGKPDRDDDNTTSAVDASFFELAGQWNMVTSFNGQEIEAVMSLQFKDGKATGTWKSGGQEMDLGNISFDGHTLKFTRTMGRGGMELNYEGTVDDDAIKGKYVLPGGELESNGTRVGDDEGNEEKAKSDNDNDNDNDADDEIEADDDNDDDRGGRQMVSVYKSRYPMGPIHQRPIIQKNGKTLLWAKGNPKGKDAEWFDVTKALINPARFQYGIGKDTIPSIDKPEFARIGDPRLAEAGINDDTIVIGFEHNGVAKAYPIMILDRHEVVNDNFKGTPFAVCW